jgi:hypothetical protein
MIKFFRKIRQNLLMENKTGKYFKYAIGEIILVVIGILIALQINNWNENRKKGIAEQNLYHTLISSLESDLEDTNDKISSVEKSIKAQEIFIINSFEEIKDKFNTVQLGEFLYSVSNSSRSFFPNYGLYEKISNNNQIDLIQSTELQMKIIELYEQYYKRYNINISMTEENHCYENALAEFVNGILKDEFYLDRVFIEAAHAKRTAKNAIKLYNEIRLHLSLNYRTPNMVYKLTA